ncbi:TerC family protein [Paenibacillus filicis]|uniref:TerC family protein n=1 Tax=Paenibacillus filicis TaxID=669464 RepID=A0ABU9DGG2_9BACL
MSVVEFIYAFAVIVFLDLILSGDNAIVIGMASRNLPKHQQRQAVLWGTAGAVALRVIATVFVLYLLQVPWLLLVGGILLLWIAYKLLVQEDSHSEIKAGTSLWSSIRTIIVADAVMSLDNVIAVAGAAQGHLVLVILGLLISIPILIKGSLLFIALVDRLPWIVYVGSAVLAYTASRMILEEPQLASYFTWNRPIEWAFTVCIMAAVLAVGWARNAAIRRKASGSLQEPSPDVSHR